MANYKIDKSLLDENEQAEWDRLVAKAKVDPEAAAEEMEDEQPEVPADNKSTEKAEVENMEDTKKSAPELAPELKAAMEELADLKKSYDMDKMVAIAKKYAPLGKKEDELAKTLYDMKKSNEANYNAYIAILDESLAIVEKSGVFSEVGKSAGAYSTAGGAEAKAEAKAKEIQKADPNISWDAAIAKAWEDPALMAEYDAEYYGRR